MANRPKPGPESFDVLPLKILFQEPGQPAAEGKAVERTVRRWVKEGRLWIERLTPGRLHFRAHPGTERPIWRTEAPPSVRPGRTVRRRHRPGAKERRDALAEYRALTEKLTAPELLRPRHEPNGWRYRHEFLRRQLGRPGAERLLPRSHASWPESAQGEGGVRRLDSVVWLRALRAELIAEGEAVPEPGLAAWP